MHPHHNTYHNDVDTNLIGLITHGNRRVKDVIEHSDITVEDMIELRHQEIFKDNPYKVFDLKSFDGLMGNMTNLN